jgi:hypothetical protein
MVIILGLVLEIFAIFRNSTTADNNQEGITR